MPIDTKILTRSCATDRFKSDVIAFASRADVASIALVRAVPRIKVVRLITQLLHAHPEWVVDRVQVDARSGCSDFVGTAVVEGGGQCRVIQFAWDCRWRAEQEGWTDAFRDLLAQLANAPSFSRLTEDLAEMQQEVVAAATRWYETASAG